MLETELNYLRSNKDSLSRLYPGKFLVIKGEDVSGAYETHEAALSAAVEMYGLTNVLIRRAEDAELEVSIPALAFGLIYADL